MTILLVELVIVYRSIMWGKERGRGEEACMEYGQEGFKVVGRVWRGRGESKGLRVRVCLKVNSLLISDIQHLSF